MTTREPWQVADNEAGIYESQFVPALFSQWAPRILDAAGVGDGDSILDVATGTGIVARTAAARVGDTGYVTGYDLTDSMCGFRAFRVSSLRKVGHVLVDMQEPQYIAAEMFIRFSRAGLKVTEVPIDLSDRGSGLSYKGFIRYGWGVTRAILRTTLGGR